jgi:hypothetical protein
VRGGSFYDQPQNVRAAKRDHDSPENYQDNLGFRPARTLTP